LDTGATITLIKLRNLKEEISLREERIVLTKVTGHKIHSIGKIRTMISLRYRRIRIICVVKNNFPIDYERILEIDFLKKQQATCDFGKKQFRISDETLKLQPYTKSILKQRTKIIIQAITSSKHRNCEGKRNNTRDIHWKLPGKAEKKYVPN